MSNPEIQYFASSGTWAKPDGAVTVDVLLTGEGTAIIGGLIADGDGYLTSWRYLAADVPGELRVGIVRNGERESRDGYALIVTHLAAGSEDGQP